MKKSVAFLFILFLGVSSLRAEIIETKHFKEITSHANADTLVVFDIDDTLLMPHQMLGSDEWFKHRMEKHQADGLPSSKALDKTVTEAVAVRNLTHMKIVEPGTDKIIQNLQKQGTRTLGLTVQSFACANRTAQHLKENNIDLLANAPSKEDHYFHGDGYSVLLRHGILFTAGKSKGDSLFALLDKIGYTPKRIVFIDDKGSNLADVEKVAKNRKIPFIGLRYSYSDKTKASFRPDVADVQFAYSSLAHLLSDEEALLILGKEDKEPEVACG